MTIATDGQGAVAVRSTMMIMVALVLLALDTCSTHKKLCEGRLVPYVLNCPGNIDSQIKDLGI